MTESLRRLTAGITVDAVRAGLRDLFFIGGLAVAAYGISLISFPGAVIFAGLAVAALAFLSTPNNEPTE